MFPSRLLGSMTLNLCPRRHLRIFSVHLRVVKPSENSTNRVKTQSKLNQNQIKSNTNQETKKNPNKQTNQNKSNKDSSNSLQIFPLHAIRLHLCWRMAICKHLLLITCDLLKMSLNCFMFYHLNAKAGLRHLNDNC